MCPWKKTIGKDVMRYPQLKIYLFQIIVFIRIALNTEKCF